MYVVYCQNKPKSEHIVSEYIETYFEVSLEYTWHVVYTQTDSCVVQRSPPPLCMTERSERPICATIINILSITLTALSYMSHAQQTGLCPPSLLGMEEMEGCAIVSFKCH